jgi:hypothetical protein
MTTKDKHAPQRTCVACRQTKEKKNLIRLVRGNNGIIEPDTSFKKPGRGAYLCPQKICWETALKKNRLEHALRTKISNDNRQILIEYSKSLPEEN